MAAVVLQDQNYYVFQHCDTGAMEVLLFFNCNFLFICVGQNYAVQNDFLFMCMGEGGNRC